ncbi:MAG TPA: vWA domain-containing protein, partial [Polyangia bacterium]
MSGLTLLRPEALWILLALPLVGAALWASLVDLSPWQQRLSALLRMLLVAALALALARPSTIGVRRTVATVLLVDVSASIGDRQLDAARKLVEDARAARRGDDVLRLVTFGAHPRLVELPPDGAPLPAEALARHDADGSDLAAALTLAYGLYPPGTLPRAVLVTDGNETEGDVAAEAAEAQRRGVRVS